MSKLTLWLWGISLVSTLAIGWAISQQADQLVELRSSTSQVERALDYLDQGSP